MARNGRQAISGAHWLEDTDLFETAATAHSGARSWLAATLSRS